jgi:hypothetical protein
LTFTDKYALPPGEAPEKGSFKLTDEQVNLIDQFSTRESVVVRAKAGAAKTTSCCLMAESQPSRKGLYLAFGKAMADEAASKLPASCRSRTTHSVAYGAVGHRFKDRLNGPRISWGRAAEILGIDVEYRSEAIGGLHLKPRNIARLASETVERYCQSDDDEIGRKHVPWVRGAEEFRSELEPYVVAKARMVWADLTSEGGRLRFSPDVYLKLWVLSRPRLRFNYLLVDEAQDFSNVQVQLINQQAEMGTQIVVVGDASQQIFEWRGSINALDRFSIAREAVLSKSFRFGPEIADEANKWLELIGDPIPVAGFEKLPSRVHDAPASSPTAILCRTNGEVVRQALEIDKRGDSFALAGGRKQVDRIRSWAKAAESLKAGKGCDHPELYLFNNWREVQEHVQEDPSDIGVMVRLIDVHGVDALHRVARRAVDQGDADVTVGTIHGFKGLESRVVQIGEDLMEPGDVPSDPEKRLFYVAVTRAQEALHRGPLAEVDELLLGHRRAAERARKMVDWSVFE